MNSTTPLIFRPSPAQRAMAALLCAGSWLVGVRALAGLLHHLPYLRWALRAAEAAGESTWRLWLVLIGSVLGCLASGGVLLAALLGLLLVEGSHVMVDELGIAVDHGALPGPVARRLGSGRLSWKRVSSLKRGGPFFVIRGREDGGGPDPVLRFLLVDELERLILLILERSPNLKLD